MEIAVRCAVRPMATWPRQHSLRWLSGGERESKPLRFLPHTAGMGRRAGMGSTLSPANPSPLGASMHLAWHLGSPRMMQTESGGVQPPHTQTPRRLQTGGGGGGGVARVIAGTSVLAGSVLGGSVLAGVDVVVAPPPSELKGSLVHRGKTTVPARRQSAPSPAEHYEPSMPSPTGRLDHKWTHVGLSGGLELLVGAEPIPLAVARKVKQKQTETERHVAYHRPKATAKDSLVAQWLSLGL